MALDLALALETAEIGAFELDVNTGHVRWSDAARDLLWLDDHEADLETLMQRIHPRDSDRVRYAVMQAIFEASPLATQFRLTPPRGPTILVELRARVTCDAAGRPKRLLGVCLEAAALQAA
ncbi:MAG: PAS domain-containing protein [Chloroflexi bacterium]|nr:PAS domain-containing protein [Chloroflexota bacterium]MBV9895304.1 PAS domain-containing protein [Chloroflexota bacterium]